MSWLRATLNVGDDALAEHRDRLVVRFCGLFGVPMLFFALLHLVNARWPLAGLNAGVAAVLFVTGWRVRMGRTPPLPLAVMVLAMVGAVTASILLQGVPGLLWAYPLIFVCYFVLPRRLATAIGGSLVGACVAATAWSLSAHLAVRVLVSLGFVLLMINIVLNVIGTLQRALVRQAITDPLTGAFNRRHMQAEFERLEVPAAGLPSIRWPSHALLAIDIDHFKQINDRHGHGVGDDVLRRVVELVAARKRAGDQLFRTGGEEFMLLLPDTGPPAALAVAEDLCQRLAASPLLPGEAVTVSIGVCARIEGQSLKAWINGADTALYEAKRAGRNRVAVSANSP